MKLLIMEESWYCSKVIMAAEELTGRAHYNITILQLTRLFISEAMTIWTTPRPDKRQRIQRERCVNTLNTEQVSGRLIS